MRRLPIFLLVDVSESMVGEPLYQLEEGIAAIAAALRKDPHALETAHLSVIAFAGKPRTLTRLTEMFAFQPPELPVGGGTALGAALEHLMGEIDREVRLGTAERKGDWKPLVFLMTDGHPTDDAAPAIARWRRDYARRANLVAVSIGPGADLDLLRRLTEEVLVLNDAAPGAFARFIQWISSSVAAQSRSVATVGDGGGVTLAKADADLLAPAAAAGGSVDDRFAVFVGRCAQSNLPYLAKYERHLGKIETDDPVLAQLFRTRRYALKSVTPVKNSYFELSEASASGQSVASGDLIGQPPCPHCSAPFGMAVCSCGNVHCLGEEAQQRCPWCGNLGTYGMVEGEGLSVGRARG